MSGSSRTKRANHAAGFDRRRLGQGMKRSYGMDNLAVHPYMPGRLGVSSRFAPDFAPAAVVRPQKFGFFNQALPSVSAGHVNERRNEASKKMNVAKEEEFVGTTEHLNVPLRVVSGSEILPASIVDEVPFDEEPRTIRPPSLNGSSAMPALSAEIIDQKHIANVLPTPADADINAAINELFVEEAHHAVMEEGGESGGTPTKRETKMVWKKLDLIKDPLRLSRLHTEIMNVLQQAVAEEGDSVV